MEFYQMALAGNSTSCSVLPFAPDCGAIYQPYDPVVLTQAKSMKPVSGDVAYHGLLNHFLKMLIT